MAVKWVEVIRCRRDDRTRHESEDRAIMIGHSDRGRTLLVVFTEQAGRLRIISAREASRRERREYEEHS